MSDEYNKYETCKEYDDCEYEYEYEYDYDYSDDMDEEELESMYEKLEKEYNEERRLEKFISEIKLNNVPKIFNTTNNTFSQDDFVKEVKINKCAFVISDDKYVLCNNFDFLKNSLCSVKLLDFKSFISLS